MSSLPKTIKLINLDDHPHLVLECAKLLDSEWPRPPEARVERMKRPCLSPPIQLALIEPQTNTVLAFAKLTIETLFDPGAFIESVVVRKDLRRQGLGRQIMEACENICKERGYKQLRLTTTDQQDFYTHLGYKIKFDQKGQHLAHSNDTANSNTKFDLTNRILMFKNI